MIKNQQFIIFAFLTIEMIFPTLFFIKTTIFKEKRSALNLLIHLSLYKSTLRNKTWHS